MTDLPCGWDRTTLGAVCERPQYGWTTSASKRSSATGRLKLLRTTDITRGRVDWNSVPYCKEEPPTPGKYRLAAGDIVISRAGSVGFSYRLTDVVPAVFASYLIRFRPSPLVDGRYLAHFLTSPTYWKQVWAAAAGIALANINAKKLAALELPLAPRAEQERIVAAIEEQFSRLDTGVATLERVRENLKRMRAAVLQGAVAGDLTSPDASRQLGELPDHWQICTPRELAQGHKHSLAIGPFGSDLKVVDYRDVGIPLVFVRQVRSGRFDGPDTRFISRAKAQKLDAHRVAAGDVLITKMGDPPGDAVVYPHGYPDAVITADVIKVSVADHILSDYLVFAINSKQVRDQFGAITSGVAQQKVTLTRFANSIKIPVPPLSEQHVIVATVRGRMEELARLEIAVAAGLNRSAALRSAILISAFSGKLVPQVGSDEPASGVLERIAAASASSNDHTLAEAPKRGRRKITS